LASDEEITLDLSSYDTQSQLYEQLDARIEEANFILSSFSKKQLITNVDTSSLDKQETNLTNTTNCFLLKKIIINVFNSFCLYVWFMVFNVSFNNISVIS